jgi:hypothetical protein
MAGWLLLLAAALTLLVLFVVIRLSDGRFRAPFGPLLGGKSRSPYDNNLVRAAEDQVSDLARVRTPKDPAP